MFLVINVFKQMHFYMIQIIVFYSDHVNEALNSYFMPKKVIILNVLWFIDLLLLWLLIPYTIESLALKKKSIYIFFQVNTR